MLERRSALEHVAFAVATSTTAVPAVIVRERRPLAILQVSAFAATIDDAGARLAAATGLELPAPNRFMGDNAAATRAVGPGIWQVIGAPGSVPSPNVLRDALIGVGTVVELSHARTAIQVAGRDAARTLAKHCGLDLDSRVFPTGSATNTRFGHLGVTLARLDDAPTFELLVFRGYAEFVFEAIADAALEFRMARAR